MLVGDDEEMVNMDTLDGSTPLHIATGYCDLPLVEYLIKEKGAVVGKRDNEGRNELHIAARSSSSERFDLTFDLINFIISHSPKCSPLIVPDKYNMTPIDYANIANKDRNLFILLRNRSITELLHSATSTCLSLSLSSVLFSLPSSLSLSLSFPFFFLLLIYLSTLLTVIIMITIL